MHTVGVCVGRGGQLITGGAALQHAAKQTDKHEAEAMQRGAITLQHKVP